MQQFDFLVIESDAARVNAVMSALHFLGYHPQHGAQCAHTDESSHAWRAVYVGGIDDVAEAERQFALLGASAAHIPVLLAEDSPWAQRLSAAKSPFAGRVATLSFPLSYEKLTEAMRNVYARLLGGRSGGLLRRAGGLRRAGVRRSGGRRRRDWRLRGRRHGGLSRTGGDGQSQHARKESGGRHY